MNSVEKEAGRVCIKTREKNICSVEMTEFVKALSKMISEYYANEEGEQD
ncbi:MAG: hypothetical protein ACOCM4_12430 [Acetivibrio ethanolgignens]